MESLAECLRVSPTVANVSASRKKSDAGNFPCLLRLGSMDANEKDNRDELKELWIHNRAYLRAMDMPQSKRNENRYFCR
jgi:hypothetical protein